MSMNIRTTGIRICLVTTLLLLAACAGRGDLRGQPSTGLDRKLSTYAYIEDGDLLDLIVGTRPTRYRDDSDFMPIEIAIANRRLKQLTLSRESFVLIDEEGNRYPCAGPEELLEGYEFLDWDREPSVSELYALIDTKYAAFTRYPSKFSPTRQVTSSRYGVVLNRVALPKFGYLMDMLYFPAPSTGIKGHKFELFVSAPELQDPVFIKFEVR
ncbi:MAG: hypothetical protein IFK94_10045 [Acidobacteria bacterium]|uniref:Lipoprotein n=1 Tax=Candidatus Polarisedimenticola svalbardensis TaxID=2886004 RepID=A0A8J6XXG6_9BACT|nr:hypothetical protein [Candidatus Polarisedimenticola svalbardensis]